MYNNIPPLPKRIQHTIIPRDSTLHEALTSFPSRKSSPT